ncbi:sulfotransferase ssu-1-like [Dermacentor andersoni]|uniref:sulfotransferase ssu-1-like n=1 Tax=Dermacentor andersoni TaxID=34620 RepID=UPI002155AD2C|nr:sulfotransferase ssu-1-like [Dermacentor andersoni]
MAARRRPYRQIIDGVPRSPWVDPDAFRRGLSFRASKGDFVQSSYPKSGTHWVQYITQLILKGGEPIDTYAEFTSNTRLIEYMVDDNWTPTLSVRTLLTHQPLCRETMNDDAKYVYVARNPWDVCVSIFHTMTNMSIYQFQDGTFEDIIDPFLEGDLGYGSYFDHVASGYALRDEPNVFFLTYEDLKRDTPGSILRLARFLGESYGKALEQQQGLLQKVLERSQPENMRKVIVFDLQGNEKAGWREMFARNDVSCKRGYGGDKTKYGLVRQAKVGGWKEHFTPDQLARFERTIRDLGAKASFMQLWSDIREEARALSGI